MIDSDLAEFSKLMDGIRNDYGKPPMSAVMVKIDFEVLRPYSFDQITMAIIKHRSNPAKSAFFPTPGDLIEHLEGGNITAGQIVAAAKLAQTPLGIMARIHIGTWDLANCNSFDLKQRAEEVLQLLPMWKEQARAGEYTDHQISIMIKHSVDPHQPFCMGLAAPIDSTALSARISHVTSTKRHQELLEEPYQEQPVDAVPLSNTLAKIEQN
jgi:hypothetical protein